MEERFGAATLKGKPLTVVGPVLQPGDKASEVTLSSKGFDGTARLLEFHGRQDPLDQRRPLDWHGHLRRPNAPVQRGGSDFRRRCSGRHRQR